MTPDAYYDAHPELHMVQTFTKGEKNTVRGIVPYWALPPSHQQKVREAMEREMQPGLFEVKKETYGVD